MDNIKTWQERETGLEGPWSQIEAMEAEIADLRAALASQASKGAGVVPDYSELSREALERHAARMAQALADDRARKFYDKYATGPMLAPSCLCCGQIPLDVAIHHAEIPGVVICKQCRDAASPATSHCAPVADAAPVGAKPALSMFASMDDYREAAQAQPVADAVLIERIGKLEVTVIRYKGTFLEFVSVDDLREAMGLKQNKEDK